MRILDQETLPKAITATDMLAGSTGILPNSMKVKVAFLS